ncbi:MAG: TrpR like protein, YerC/YecD [uncultured bacterium]|nr:MAG: TrpR like protein, YerC/YecD [uncultured bacterium]HBD05465.1 DNA-binding transcriptional regulator [Candidatus Uhrbacteria bacterium]
MPAWKTAKLQRLAKALLSMRTENEMRSFLRDIATIEELNELSNRWDAVLQLKNGKNYRDVALNTGMSTATITRIAHWLNYGEGGYMTALKRLKK